MSTNNDYEKSWVKYINEHPTYAPLTESVKLALREIVNLAELAFEDNMIDVSMMEDCVHKLKTVAKDQED